MGRKKKSPPPPIEFITLDTFETKAPQTESLKGDSAESSPLSPPLSFCNPPLGGNLMEQYKNEIKSRLSPIKDGQTQFRPSDMGIYVPPPPPSLFLKCECGRIVKLEILPSPNENLLDQ